MSTQTGDFSWSYPLRVPPAVNGPAPELTIGYSSGSVDGRTASTNNQPSWIGEGHGMETGYVERKYVSCSDDMSGGNNTTTTGDLCWKTENATLVLGGRSGELVKAADGSWRLEKDDGSRIVRLTGAANGARNGEYWRLTTTDGTHYYFGLHKRYATDTAATNSTWTVPVFGNQSGEPCHATSYASSSCTQAWRWNVDYVVDPHGNTMTYNYGKETNNYGRNNNTAVSSYVRGGYLKSIEYGERAGSEHTTSAPSKVAFTIAERCTPSGTITCAESQLTAANARYWPDVPYDQICTSSTSCPNAYAPAFFTRKRLTGVTTSVWGGSAYSPVDHWALTQSFPATGDETSAGLWLNSIQHTGKVGGDAVLPYVSFTGVQLDNRVDYTGDGAPRMIKWRIAGVHTESGGRISVTYSDKECVPGSNMLSAPHTNTKRCFPINWAAEGQQSSLHYFHKYVVTQVVQDDASFTDVDQVSSYSYVGSPAWAYDDNELTLPKNRTWGNWRGYQSVDVKLGAPGQQTRSRYLYLRGMNGDYLPGGGKRSVTVTDSQGGTVADHPRANGFVRETITYNGAAGAEISGTINDLWVSAATATSGSKTATLMGTAKTRTRTALAAGGHRVSEVATTFDGYGMPTQVDDRGDVATATDDMCTRNTYVRNSGSWIMSNLSRSETVSAGCAATPDRPADVVSDQRMYYDGATSLTTAPTRGLLTRAETLTGWTTDPVYTTTTTATYDAHGRALTAADVLGRTTQTGYTPATGGPVTAITTTNAKGHVATKTLNPAWGNATVEEDANGRRTDLAFDPVGRLTAVWLPGRSKSGGATPNMKFGYTMSRTGLDVVTT
ncbi:MAG: hypothetical protein ACRDT6_27870, partial [Micromonosporaceae bacterium]